MRVGIPRMGAQFGNLFKLRGIVYYTLSPFEQKAFAGAIKRGVPNTIRRCSESFWKIIPSCILAYGFYAAVEAHSDQLKRKNPDNYACDV